MEHLHLLQAHTEAEDMMDRPMVVEGMVGEDTAVAALEEEDAAGMVVEEEATEAVGMADHLEVAEDMAVRLVAGMEDLLVAVVEAGLGLLEEDIWAVAEVVLVAQADLVAQALMGLASIRRTMIPLRRPLRRRARSTPSTALRTLA